MKRKKNTLGRREKILNDATRRKAVTGYGSNWKWLKRAISHLTLIVEESCQRQNWEKKECLRVSQKKRKSSTHLMDQIPFPPFAFHVRSRWQALMATNGVVLSLFDGKHNHRQYSSDFLHRCSFFSFVIFNVINEWNQIEKRTILETPKYFGHQTSFSVFFFTFSNFPLFPIFLVFRSNFVSDFLISCELCLRHVNFGLSSSISRPFQC